MRAAPEVVECDAESLETLDPASGGRRRWFDDDLAAFFVERLYWSLRRRLRLEMPGVSEVELSDRALRAARAAVMDQLGVAHADSAEALRVSARTVRRDVALVANVVKDGDLEDAPTSRIPRGADDVIRPRVS
jgi:hypothetical protein